MFPEAPKTAGSKFFGVSETWREPSEPRSTKGIRRLTTLPAEVNDEAIGHKIGGSVVNDHRRTHLNGLCTDHLVCPQKRKNLFACVTEPIVVGQQESVLFLTGGGMETVVWQGIGVLSNGRTRLLVASAMRRCYGTKFESAASIPRHSNVLMTASLSGGKWIRFTSSLSNLAKS